MKGGFAVSRPLGATIVLAGVAVVGGLLLAWAAADRDALMEERDAKTAFTGRPLVAARQGGPEPEASRDLSVVATSAGLAAAQVEALVRATLTKAGAIVQSSRAEIKGHTSEGGPADRIEMQAVVQGTMDALQAGLFRLEGGRPLILVDRVDLRRSDEGEAAAQEPSSPALTASLTLSAFWKPARAR